ncbi:hypothetical protein DL93DRAFT_412183 [Clavulina sp. PMI_390]|nr:hypothetical protein DL93DRAFT_412183 [Clavulina sp. PMI_390]
MNVLAKGAACFRCRKLKEKCDGTKPSCFRCQSRHETCFYPTGVARRRFRSATNVLEARALELEIIVNKLTLASMHDLSLVSAGLLKRIARLGDISRPEVLLRPDRMGTGSRGALIRGDEITQSYISVIRKHIIEAHMDSSLSTGYEPLPLPSSLYLVHLLLPFRAQYYFFIDLPHFLHRVSLSPSDPESIHPCLLNACYLAACACNRGNLAFFQPYFLQRTRHFMEQALMFCDRITDFLWASVILAGFFAQERRLEECFATAGAATRFGYACGLALPHDSHASGSEEPDTAAYLLPPPQDDAEAIDRTRLAHCLYLLDQTLPALGNYVPSFPYNNRWGPAPEVPLVPRSSQNSIEMDEPTLELQHSRTDFRISMARVFERVAIFAQGSLGQGRSSSLEEYGDITAQMDNLQLIIPPLSSARRSPAPGNMSALKTDNIFEHTTPYGSGLILYSVRAGTDIEARRNLLHCVQALVDICRYTRTHRNSGRVQIGFANLVHILNALRVIARELQRSDTRTNTKVLVNYCNNIGTLLDFIDDVVVLFPAWSNSPRVLKDTLISALTPITTQSGL